MTRASQHRDLPSQLLHFIFFIGSLFEPYDSLLPKKSFLKFFIRAVQKAKRDYDVKHGLVPPPTRPTRAPLSMLSGAARCLGCDHTMPLVTCAGVH